MVALFATAMMLCSCSKESQIVGKWKITKAPSEWSETDKGETWTFKEGGSCTVFVYGMDLDGDWSVSKESYLNPKINYDTFGRKYNINCMY